MRLLTCILLIMLLHQKAPSQERIFLYPATTPGITIPGFDTTAPFMDYYPSKNTSTHKTAVVICPGGSYTHLAWDKEGVVPARIFNESGIDAFVLRYRLNNDKQEGHRYPDQYNDVTTAIRIIRSKQAAWGIDPLKLGVMGFSAGGHLASTAATILQKGNPNALNPLEKYDTRPSFAILVYPVITMDTSFAHKYSRQMLLGKKPDLQLEKALSTEERVTENTPPTLLIHADDDKAVVPKNSVAFYEALKKHGVPASLFIFDHGGHGFGTAPKDPALNQWPKMCIDWMARLGFN